MKKLLWLVLLVMTLVSFEEVTLAESSDPFYNIDMIDRFDSQEVISIKDVLDEGFTEVKLRSLPYVLFYTTETGLIDYEKTQLEIWKAKGTVKLTKYDENERTTDESEFSILTGLEDTQNSIMDVFMSTTVRIAFFLFRISLYIFIGYSVVRLPFFLLSQPKYSSKRLDDVLVIRKLSKRKLKLTLKRLCMNVFEIKTEDIHLFEREDTIVADVSTLFGRFVLTINLATPTTVTVKQQESEPMDFQLTENAKKEIQAHYQFDWADF